jgi:hypothetical protein
MGVCVSSEGVGPRSERKQTPCFEIVPLYEEHHEREEFIVAIDDAEEVAGVALREHLRVFE